MKILKQIKQTYIRWSCRNILHQMVNQGQISPKTAKALWNFHGFKGDAL